MNTINWASIFNPKSMAYMILGALSVVFALKGFLIPNHFLDGGVTGISILAHEIFHVDISWVLVVLNIPFLIIGYKKLGASFAMHSFITILFLAVFIHFLEVPIVTTDKILIAFFGGFFMGLGVGLAIRSGAVIDGLEIIADYTQKKFGFTTSEIILFINSIIFLLAALSFGIEAAMYSIVTYFTATRISDYVVEGIEEYTALHIISKNYDEVKEMIVKDHNKAITVYKGERGYLPGSYDVKSDVDIVMTIVTRLEMHRIKRDVNEMDPTAFIFVQNINEVKGGIIKKLRKH